MKSILLLSLFLVTTACGGGGAPGFKPLTVEVPKFNPPDFLNADSTSSFSVDDSSPGQWKALKLRETLRLISIPSNEVLMSAKILSAKNQEKLMKTDISKRKDFLTIKGSYSDLFQSYNLIAKPITNFGTANERSIVYFYDAEKKTKVEALSPIIIKAYNQIFLDVMIYLNAVEMTSEDGSFDAADLAAIDTARTKMEATQKTQGDVIKKEKEILLTRFHRETNRVRYVANP